MGWDLSLLRKFSSTGHFRLLNQVRSELKAQPLVREEGTRLLNIQARPMRGAPTRVSKRPNALEGIESENTFSEDSSDGARSFRDRLNAIDMR